VSEVELRPSRMVEPCRAGEKNRGPRRTSRGYTGRSSTGTPGWAGAAGRKRDEGVREMSRVHGKEKKNESFFHFDGHCR
jgi:hypothetical protein